MLHLPDDVAHLWYVSPDDVKDEDLIAAYHRLMSPDEAAQQQRFYFPKGRHEYLVTRALARTTLSRYADVRPEDWTFRRNEYGRPAISGPAGVPPIRFNLSNTTGLIACLVAMDRDVGVDVEDTERDGRTVELADRFFSPAEARALRACPEAMQRERFFAYWTLKEAYIKARGMGLAIPLDQFSFDLRGDEIGIAIDERLRDAEDTWQFSLMRPTSRHCMAAAIRKGSGAPLRIEQRRVVPLLDGA